MQHNINYIDSQDQDRYRELQYIWHSSLEFLAKKRYGLGIRLLQEGIRMAQSPGYNDPSRLYQITRDLAGAYYDIGDAQRAIELYGRIGHHAELGFIYINMGSIEKAISEYEKAALDGELWNYKRLAHALFLASSYHKSLDAYIEWGKKGIKREIISAMTRRDCFIVLICLQYKYGSKLASTNCSELRNQLGNIYNAIIARFGNWKSALSHFCALDIQQEIGKIKTSLFKKHQRVSHPDFDFREEEVQIVLASAKLANHTWEEIINASRSCKDGSYKKSRDLICSLCDSNPQLWIYGKDFCVDLFMLEGDYEGALEWGSEWLKNNAWNKYLNLLYIAGKKLCGSDIAYHYRYLIDHCTPWLFQHQNMLADIIQEKLDQFERDAGLDLLHWIVNKYRAEAIYSWGLFIGTGLESELVGNSPFLEHANHMVCFYAIEEFEAIIGNMLQDIENIVRDRICIPRIGEGWVSESDMFSLATNLFASQQVIFHAAPNWLKPQHFDVYIPSLKLAIEYQGKQHYEAVEFFGGEAGLKEIQKRDSRKYELAKLNGVQIEYIRYDQDIRQRLCEIAGLHGRSNNKDIGALRRE